MKLAIRIGLGLGGGLVLLTTYISVQFARTSSKTFARPEFRIHDEVTKADPEVGKRIYMVRNGCVECHGADLAGAPIMESGAIGSIHGSNIRPFGARITRIPLVRSRGCSRS